MEYAGDFANWITAISWAVIGVAALSAIAVVLDIARGHRQVVPLMNVAYVGNAAYLGFLELPFYFGWLRNKTGHRLSERRAELLAAGVDSKAADDRARRELDGPQWVSAIRANSHHGWSCWLGDIIGAWLVFLFGWKIADRTLYAHFAVEFGLALVLSIAVSIVSRRMVLHMSAPKALVTALLAETIAVSAMMFTLFAWMAAIQVWWFQPPIATNTAAFWGINMIPGMIFGYLVSYPVVMLLMKTGLKESM